MDKTIEKFVNAVMLLGAEEFIGLARLMKVSFVKWDESDDTQKPVPRDAEEVGLEMVTAFNLYNRKQKRNLMKLLKATIKGRKTRPDWEKMEKPEVNNGATTDSNEAN